MKGENETIDYVVVSNTSLSKLVIEINQYYLPRGYKPAGGITIRERDYTGDVYHQAIFKDRM